MILYVLKGQGLGNILRANDPIILLQPVVIYVYLQLLYIDAKVAVWKNQNAKLETPKKF